MHLYNDNSPIPPQGNEVYVVCPHPVFKTNIGESDMGKEAISMFCYDIVIDLVKEYLDKMYTGAVNLASVYADIYTNMESVFENELHGYVSGLYDECVHADSSHRTLHENLLEYFNHDTLVIVDALVEIYRSHHEVMFYPVTNMIELCRQSGQTLDPTNLTGNASGIIIVMEMMKNEYAYHQYEYRDYPHTPFGLRIPGVRTTAEIGCTLDRGRPQSIYPVVYPTPDYPLAYPGVVG